MFKAANPYDDIVNKATAETLTSENWELNLNVCDKVSSEGETGARNCLAAIQKRIIHRNANVQLYSLTLCDTLAKNCGIEAHRELASRTFTQTLQRVVVDRNTHETVRNKTLELIKEWAKDFGSDDSLGMIGETMDLLKGQGYKFDDSSHQEAPPAEPSSDLLRKEDEELRRVLELSMQDVGGRGTFSSNNVGGSASSNAAASSSSAGGMNGDSRGQAGSAAAVLLQDKTLPDPNSSRVQGEQSSVRQTQVTTSPPSISTASAAPTRVRALYDFAPSELGELAFSKGDLIRVLDSVYEHWWRGELRGEAGIFPVNYVEILPSPSPAEIQRDAEQEARIFAQAHDIDRLLGRLRSLDPTRENLADDEELQDLYQSSLAMRPKIVRLIDRYSSKVDELRSMNEKFVKARSVYDGMMERSLAQHQYRGPAGGSAPPSASHAGARPEYAPVQHGGVAPQHQQGGWQGQQHVQHHPQQPPQAASSSAAGLPPHQGAYAPPPQQDQLARAQYHAQQQMHMAQQPQHPPQSQPQQGYASQPQQTQHSYAPQAQQGTSSQPQQMYQPHAQPHVQQQEQPPHNLQSTQAYAPTDPRSPPSSYGAVPYTATQQQQGGSTGLSAGSGPGPSSSSAAAQPQQQPSTAGGSGGASGGGYVGPPVPVIVQEDEKKRLYEQARREAEAYHAAYGPAGSASGQ